MGESARWLVVLDVHKVSKSPCEACGVGSLSHAGIVSKCLNLGLCNYYGIACNY